jgi:iron complex outermembrane receptor protein
MAWDGTEESILAKDYRDNPRGLDNPDLFSQTHVQLQNINTFNKKTKLSSTLFYNHLEGHYDNFNLRDVNTNGYYANEHQHSNWLGYIAQYNYTTKNTRAAAGVSVNTYTRNHRGTEYYNSTTSFDYINSGTKNEASGFVKASFDDVNITYYIDLQERYVEYNYSGDVSLAKKSWTFFNPKVGFKVFENDRFNYYYTIGVSHREPTRSVMFNGGMYLTQFNSVRPEKVVDYEIGLNYKSSKVTLQADLFYMDFSDEIIPVGPVGNNSLPTMINVDKSVRGGFEADLDYKLSDLFTYDVNTTVSSNTYGDLGKHQVFSPTMIANQSLSLEKNNFSASLSHTFFSRSFMDLDNKFTTPSYNVFGLNLGYTYKKYNVTIQGNNLANSKYYSNGYIASNTKFLYPNALFNYYVTLKARF